jgi:hypothetical protein
MRYARKTGTPSMRMESLKNRYERLSRKLIPKGWICIGSAIERTYSRPAGGKWKRFGPYYSWTRKIDNKTVTLALTRPQFNALQQAIHRQRKLYQILMQLQDISARYILTTSPCVTTRKRS